ncbi:ribosome biogenesis factor YjgA [Candidatus Colwellia aromaticivorans]|uniref:ribosome biogenesis factor YjgA n=1 Tax=Candidatus Colwellia aromaticivorans TaxID=2267621 RepID=UPI000DF21D9D|nr:ribosome biogenesis factor YjgA [Candidatus Colwellia aromaticivorans]
MPQSANDIDDLSSEIDQELKSKTEIKKEMHQLQDFGQKLIEMSKHQRSRLPLTDDLKYAMIVADKIRNKNEALRRHIRHIAKILVETDLAPIYQAIDVMANKHQQETAKFTRLENLRDELIEQGNDAIEALLAEFEQLERQKLKQLVRHAAKEKKAEKLGKHYRNLFTYLKENS